ncbi:hypothetical protein IAQ61_005289 [Plenodomus lingam]|uniref:uncharacterized protein n=1 Tax=Leptosphaeria maculans TaxID=5022 RepID=UPI003321F544|nr:hypothetical protein IAQ61_005289 [Plenodomus lingam]
MPTTVSSPNAKGSEFIPPTLPVPETLPETGISDKSTATASKLDNRMLPTYHSLEIPPPRNSSSTRFAPKIGTARQYLGSSMSSLYQIFLGHW